MSGAVRSGEQPGVESAVRSDEWSGVESTVRSGEQLSVRFGERAGRRRGHTGVSSFPEPSRSAGCQGHQQRTGQPAQFTPDSENDSDNTSRHW